MIIKWYSQLGLLLILENVKTFVAIGMEWMYFAWEKDMKTWILGGWSGMLCIVSLSYPNSCWNPKPNMMVLGDGDFGAWLGHESETLMKGISALTKES